MRPRRSPLAALGLTPDQLAQIVVAAVHTPRAVLLERMATAGLVIGADLAAKMHRHMIDSAPPEPPAKLATAPRADASPQFVQVEVITVDPSKLSKQRAR